MEPLIGGDSGGSSGGGSTESSVISKEEEEVVVEQENNSINTSTNEVCDDDSELELGLGLSLSCNNNSKITARFFTAKNLPCMGLRGSSSSNHNVSVGTKRAASPTSSSQVVGWPPIRSYRMNSMSNQAKTVATGENNSEYNDIKGKDEIYGKDEKANAKSKERVAVKSGLFVKVNMDGVAIGRKVDLNAHSSYESLAQTLEEMFTNKAVEKSSGEELILMPQVVLPSKLLDGTSDFVLTYEDKDGDWMLVGDVPWGMFLSSVKRLRIMRTSEANGLAPRSEERCAKQRSWPI